MGEQKVSGPHRRVSSGEHARIEAREQPDGSYEFVMAPVVKPVPEPESERLMSNMPLKQSVLASLRTLRYASLFLPLLAVLVWASWGVMASSEDAVNTLDEDEEISFKPYSGIAGTAVLKFQKKAPARVVKKASKFEPAPVESEEERAAWKMAEESGKEVVVLDETAQEPESVLPTQKAPAKRASLPPLWKRKPRFDEASLRLDRRANIKQREMLKELNAKGPLKFRPRNIPLKQLYKIPKNVKRAKRVGASKGMVSDEVDAPFVH